MSDIDDDDLWIYFDGPEPDDLQLLLDELRDLPPATAAHRERAVRRFFEQLDGAAPSTQALASPEEGRASESLPIGSRVNNREPQVVEAPPSGYLVAREEPPPPPVPSARAPSILASTNVQLDIPSDSRGLPFTAPAAVPAVNAPAKAAPTTLKVRAMNNLGDTLPIGDDSIAKAMAAALPFKGNTVGSGVVPFPRLNLNEYTSLRAELAVHPERVEQLRLAYHVLHTASHEALDEHWRKHFAAHPEARVEFDTKLAWFTAHVRERRE